MIWMRDLGTFNSFESNLMMVVLALFLSGAAVVWIWYSVSETLVTKFCLALGIAFMWININYDLQNYEYNYKSTKL